MMYTTPQMRLFGSASQVVLGAGTKSSDACADSGSNGGSSSAAYEVDE